MIQISLTTALLIYGGIIVVGFAFIYVLSELRASHMYRVLEKQFLWRCAFCGYVYLDEDALTVSQCPRCASFNTGQDAQDRAVSTSKQQAETVFADDNAAQTDLETAPGRNSAKRKRHGQTHRGPRRRR